MSKAIKFYYDFLSQPSRALWIGLKLSETPFEDCPVALRKREQLSEEYKKINRFGKVPAIVDGDFHLSESVAIVRYLAGKGDFKESLYPKDLKQRSHVDEYLEWQHLTIRYSCSSYFRNLWLLPVNGLAPMPTDDQIKKLRKEMETNLGGLEKFWLQKSKFLNGDQMTVADLFAATEIEQLKLTKYDVGEKYAKIGKWLEEVRDAANPHYAESHKFIWKMAAAAAAPAK